MTPDDAGTDGRFDSGAWARIQAVEAWGHGLVEFFDPQFLIQFVDATAETPATVPTPAQLLACRHFSIGLAASLVHQCHGKARDRTQVKGAIWFR